MLTAAPTPEMISEWKRIFELCRATLPPNRKTGAEVDGYFRTKYPYERYDSPELRQIATLNIADNDHSRAKLPKGALPDIRTYKTGNTLVAIDLQTGEFHIESEDLDEVIAIHDDLFVYRGLDKADLNNFFLVAEYVKLSQK